MFMSHKARNAKLALLLSAVVLVGGCATSPKVQPVRMGDNKLTREQLAMELNRLDEAQQKIESNKGLTGTNVAAALFWLPGLAYTYYDAGEATRLVEQRRAHLTALYNNKMEGKKRAASDKSA